MLSGLDFYARVATRGQVLGVGVGARPAEWEAALGGDFLDVEEAGLLRRDHGLVELTFQEEGGAWPCVGVSVRADRLRWDTASHVPAPLREAYGDFAASTRFGELAGAIARLGCTVAHEPDAAGTTEGFHRHRVPESGARIFVRADEDARREAGVLWTLSVSPGWWAEAG
ncbi:hypothetical protein ACWIGE_07595 [Streptomyces diastaticus]